MAEFGAGELVRGFINLEPLAAGVTAVHFNALPQVMRILHLPEEALSPVKILEIDENEDRVRIYPVGTHPTADIYGKPKYTFLRMISVPVEYVELPEEVADVVTVLENLPRGFLKDCQFGLGLAKAYHPIVTAIETQTKCSQLYLETEGDVRVDDQTLLMSLADFEELRVEADRISSRANRAALNVKKASAMNWLARRFGQEEVPYRRGRHPMIQSFADAAADSVDEESLESLLEIVDKHAASAVIARPEVVAKLKGDIELVQLDTLIDRFDSMLRSAHPESVWQAFFTENTFILSFAFGYPMILVQDQAVAGGRKISGSGEKIADFISKNPATNNVAIIEIKKPSTPLLQRNEYRGGIYGPSTELSGSVVQILDQRYHLLGEFSNIQRASRIYDIESFAVQLCLIVGQSPNTPDEAKSFEIFRDSLTAVTIVTFDELLQRVRLLRSFLDQ